MKVFSLTTLWKNEMKKIVLKRKAARIRVKSESKATWHFGYLLFFFFPSTSLCCLLTSMHVSVHTQACMQLLMFMCTHSRMCEYTFVHTLVHSHSHTHPHENTLIVVHTSTLHAYSHYAHSFAYSQGYLYSHAYTLAYLHSLMSHTVPAPPPHIHIHNHEFTLVYWQLSEQGPIIPIFLYADMLTSQKLPNWLEQFVPSFYR